MELKEKVAYIKGLMEGLEMDESKKDVKVLNAIIDILNDMAVKVTEIDEDVDELYDEVDAISEDLTDVEDYLFEDDDDDEDDEDDDDDDDDSEYEDGLYEITCPQCGDVVCVDEDMLADESLACPNCGTKFEVDFAESDEAEDKNEG